MTEKQRTIVQYANKIGVNTLVESGTYLGETIEALRNVFHFIYSIELDNELWASASLRFKEHPNIFIVHGDSGERMPWVISLAESFQPIIFWLDGHYSEGITARGEENTPILKELEAIFMAREYYGGLKEFAILIDDARCFRKWHEGYPESWKGYPTIEELEQVVRGYDEKVVFEVLDDIIRIELQ